MRELLGLPLVATMALLAGSAVEAEVRSDWSKVQAISPGKRVAVLLHKDDAPSRDRKITVRFGHGRERHADNAGWAVAGIGAKGRSEDPGQGRGREALLGLDCLGDRRWIVASLLELGFCRR